MVISVVLQFYIYCKYHSEVKKHLLGIVNSAIPYRAAVAYIINAVMWILLSLYFMNGRFYSKKTQENP